MSGGKFPGVENYNPLQCSAWYPWDREAWQGYIPTGHDLNMTEHTHAYKHISLPAKLEINDW